VASVDGIVIPADAERVSRGTGTFRVLAELPELEVIDMRFGPKFERVDPHTHDDHVDSFYVLEGEAEFTVGDEVVRATPGTFVAAPAGLVHGFRSVGDVDLRILNVHAPNSGFARRFRD
jgi:mannose-6-phosphate isomerase-like protein (cupin superfamily)